MTDDHVRQNAPEKAHPLWGNPGRQDLPPELAVFPTATVRFRCPTLRSNRQNQIKRLPSGYQLGIWTPKLLRLFRPGT